MTRRSAAKTEEPLANESPQRLRGPKTLRPRDAGTLLIVDERGPVPRILMGRRSSKLLFMPGKYVFPGGRVEMIDRRLGQRFPLPPAAEARLMAATTSRFDALRAAGLALAAIRETFEEVGAAIGTRGAFEVGDDMWRRFADCGVVPNPGALAPIARAITPPGPPRRYDTRFFCVSSTDIAAELAFDERPDHEFDTVAWFSLDEIGALDLPGITRQVLSDIDTRLRDGSWRDTRLAMPFYRMRHGRFVRDLI